MKRNTNKPFAINQKVHYSVYYQNLKSRFELSNLISQGSDFQKLTTAR